MKNNIKQNIEALQQGEMLLQHMSDLAYTSPAQLVFNSTVGTHIRHNLDHYDCFLSGLDSGCIDYAARERDSRLEQDRSFAIIEMSRLQGCLESLAEEAGGICLFVERDHGSGRAITSISRELEFLLSHTIHHYALVAIICQLQGINVDADFGIAPSTLRHRSSQVA